MDITKKIKVNSMAMMMREKISMVCIAPNSKLDIQ